MRASSHDGYVLFYFQMKETAVSLLGETTTEGRRALRGALWMNRNADSFLRETLGVHTSRGLNAQGGGGEYKADLGG